MTELDSQPEAHNGEDEPRDTEEAITGIGNEPEPKTTRPEDVDGPTLPVRTRHLGWGGVLAASDAHRLQDGMREEGDDDGEDETDDPAEKAALDALLEKVGADSLQALRARFSPDAALAKVRRLLLEKQAADSTNEESESDEEDS